MESTRLTYRSMAMRTSPDMAEFGGSQSVQHTKPKVTTRKHNIAKEKLCLIRIMFDIEAGVWQGNQHQVSRVSRSNYSLRVKVLSF